MIPPFHVQQISTDRYIKARYTILQAGIEVSMHVKKKATMGRTANNKKKATTTRARLEATSEARGADTNSGTVKQKQNAPVVSVVKPLKTMKKRVSFAKATAHSGFTATVLESRCHCSKSCRTALLFFSAIRRNKELKSP